MNVAGYGSCRQCFLLSKCLNKNKCYKLFMFDTYGDGFINDDDAWYEARFNGKLGITSSIYSFVCTNSILKCLDLNQKQAKL